MMLLIVSSQRFTGLHTALCLVQVAGVVQSSADAMHNLL
jgi:hypothetical protein